ncbi:hypothetical protein CAPTEDRAFT_186483 [Capitella teleta]|uniref:DUF6729 domain-containing protein n=1 Tax=Capitella teleta TaxID=283909 RepID=R7TWQ6_CAPTE|nr:hypothetical protein CAPTEDRAFT_186483 [Capitella teleta]|eukprot:ELT98323.1 hypothetical protein CAPTEDRAFT_186483 [Capitella teleta]
MHIKSSSQLIGNNDSGVSYDQSFYKYYLIGTEYLKCSPCTLELPGWSLMILNQLDASTRSMFPAICTYRRLSAAIFEWDSDDVHRLLQARCAVSNRSEERELGSLKHCKRPTPRDWWMNQGQVRGGGHSLQ